MREIIEVKLSEHTNGYTLKAHRDFEYFIDEIQEERLEALRSLEQWVKAEIIAELERRTENASVL